MTASAHPDDLADLRAIVVAQGAELAALRARFEAHARHRPRQRRRAATLLALLVALVPLGLAAAVPFTDLDPAQNGPTGHNPNIEAIYAAGITKGCTPTEYCPKDGVTREQMASFLARTAGLGGNPPVANALTAVNAQNAVNAQDTAQLGGQPASAYTRAATLATHTETFVGSSAFPQTGTSFTAVGTRGLLIVSGSAYRANAGFLRVDVMVVPTGQSSAPGGNAGVYTNEGGSHRALQTGLTTVSLQPGTTYRFIATKDPQTILNGSDYISYMLLELP